jgi:hypothetical protein
MPVLEIIEVKDTGEYRWGLSLLTDEGKTVLRTTTPLAKGVAHTTAKALKQKGPDAPLVDKDPPPLGFPSWVPEKTDGVWLLRFTLVADTLFDPLIKPEDAGDPKITEEVVAVIKINLEKADVTWSPPSADPAAPIKESDLTETLGYPGSAR